MKLGRGPGLALVVAALFVSHVGGALAGDAAMTVAPVAAAPAGPTTDDAFVAKVRAAIAAHDLELFDKTLIDWDGARKRMQRLTLFQLRECFGRPIKSVGIEPLKLDPSAPLVPEGYRTNLPVTHLLRIAFDETHPANETPACVFMLSKGPSASYRIALVLPTTPPN